jgi:hypothetical protein
MDSIKIFSLDLVLDIPNHDLYSHSIVFVFFAFNWNVSDKVDDVGMYSEFESHSGRGVQHYVIKFVSDLRQVGGFLRVIRFLPIKLPATI